MPAIETAEKLSRIIKRIRSLPTLPTVYREVQTALKNPDVSAGDVARIIESDQSVASKVLRLVNSSYFGFASKITSLRQAVVMLGFNAVRNALLTISVIHIFGKGKGDDFDRNKFWKHALATAATARFISLQWRLGIHEDAYAAGILHDIGKVILDQYHHEEFIRALLLSRDEKIPLFEAERRVIGITHSDVGEFLAESWSLPVKLAEGIALHHRPKIIRSEPKLVAVVHMANAMARQMGLGHSGDYGPAQYAEVALEELGVREDDVMCFIPRLKSEFDSAPDLFALFE